jgi:hypothetical protein
MRRASKGQEKREGRPADFREGKRCWRRGWESNQAPSLMRRKLLKMRNTTWDKSAKNAAVTYTEGTRGQCSPYSTGIDNFRATEHCSGMIGSEPKLPTTPFVASVRVAEHPWAIIGRCDRAGDSARISFSRVDFEAPTYVDSEGSEPRNQFRSPYRTPLALLQETM